MISRAGLIGKCGEMWLLIKHLEFSASGATQDFILDFFLMLSCKLQTALVIHLQTS